MISAALAVLLALPALAADAPPLPELAPSKSTPGWARQGKSLVLYDAEGSLSNEIPLFREENGPSTREVQGAPSPEGQAAWTLERKLTWDARRVKLLESRRALKIVGMSAQTLWTDEAADWPEKGEPVIFSNDSKTVFYARRTGEAWAVEARDWAGATKLVGGPYAKLISIGLAPGGRYAVARWGVPDKSDTHTFFDLWTKAKKDIETSELTLGLARIGDDGVVRSGRRAVFSFDAAVSTSDAKGAAPK